jgi:hypothetical protein
MGTRLYPLTGYPFLLDVAVDYVLDDEGLTVTTTATNRGEQTCPYGCGQHPYLSPGGGLVNDAVLSFAAGNRIITDPHRQLPTGTEPVGGGCFDFSQGRRLEDLRIDYAFFDLARDGAGRAWVRLEGPDGKRAELWVDGSYPIVELFTGDTLSPHRRRRGLGTEPMTCPPNAFQSGEAVLRLAPGEVVTNRWGARLRAGVNSAAAQNRPTGGANSICTGVCTLVSSLAVDQRIRRPDRFRGHAGPRREGDHVDHKIAHTLRTCTQWRKSSYSFPDGQECVEITTELARWVGVRDSKLGAASPVLAVTPAQWQAMLLSL